MRRQAGRERLRGDGRGKMSLTFDASSSSPPPSSSSFASKSLSSPLPFTTAQDRSLRAGQVNRQRTRLEHVIPLGSSLMVAPKAYRRIILMCVIASVALLPLSTRRVDEQNRRLNIDDKPSFQQQQQQQHSRPRIISIDYPSLHTGKVVAPEVLTFNFTSTDFELEAARKSAWKERNHFIPESEKLGCPFVADWQIERNPHPICNSVHEIGMRLDSGHEMTKKDSREVSVKHIANGGCKDVWTVRNEVDQRLYGRARSNYVIKTQVYDHSYHEKDLDKHRIDAIVMEQTTSSPHILNMHAYCGFTHVVESAPTTLKHWIAQESMTATSYQKLQVATQVATALSDSHLFHGDTPTVAHTDIKSDQFLLTEEGSGMFKLNDFNRGFLLTSKEPPEICPFIYNVNHQGSRSRAPEEYIYDGPQTDKVDVFALGSVFYELLTTYKPFAGTDYELARDYIANGTQPELPDDIATSSDPSIAAIVEAMHWARSFKASDRPSSKRLAKQLQTKLNEIAASQKQTAREAAVAQQLMQDATEVAMEAEPVEGVVVAQGTQQSTTTGTAATATIPRAAATAAE